MVMSARVRADVDILTVIVEARWLSILESDGLSFSAKKQKWIGFLRFIFYAIGNMNPNATLFCRRTCQREEFP
jgi:hypothetical protein